MKYLFTIIFFIAFEVTLFSQQLSIGLETGPSIGLPSSKVSSGIAEPNAIFGINIINEFERKIFFKTGLYSLNMTYGYNSTYFKNTFVSTTDIRGLSIPLNIGRKIILGSKLYIGPYLGITWLNNRTYSGIAYSSSFAYQNNGIQVQEVTNPTIDNILLGNAGFLLSFGFAKNFELNFTAAYSQGFGNVRKTDINYSSSNPIYNNLHESYVSKGSNAQFLLGVNYLLTSNHTKNKKANKYWKDRYGYYKDSSELKPPKDSTKNVDIYNKGKRMFGFGWDLFDSDGVSFPVLSSSYNMQLRYYYFLLRKFAIGYNIYIFRDHYQGDQNYLVSDFIATNGLNARYYLLTSKNTIFLDGNFDIGYQWYKNNQNLSTVPPSSGNGLVHWFSTGLGYAKSIGKKNRISLETKVLYRHYTKLLNEESLTASQILLNISINYHFKK